jgi:hypothetical protein
LFRRRIRERAYRHVGGGQAADVSDAARDSEVAQKDSLLITLGIGDQDIRGLDVAVEQTVLMPVVERAGDRCD